MPTRSRNDIPGDLSVGDIALIGSNPKEPVKELVISFSHATVIDRPLPGVPPTGKHGHAAVVVVGEFREGKISHDHIYWDHAGILVQVGLLDPTGLPATGAESTRKVIHRKLPPRRM